MLFEGSLSGCIDHLARIPAHSWANSVVVIHVPADKRYKAYSWDDFHVMESSIKRPGYRLVFQGSINEMAHFVLCPPMTDHATRHTLPDLVDNEPNPSEAAGPDTSHVSAADGSVLPDPPPAAASPGGDNGNSA